jgi:hypothetical protein
VKTAYLRFDSIHYTDADGHWAEHIQSTGPVELTDEEYARLAALGAITDTEQAAAEYRAERASRPPVDALAVVAGAR